MCYAKKEKKTKSFKILKEYLTMNSKNIRNIYTNRTTI